MTEEKMPAHHAGESAPIDAASAGREAAPTDNQEPVYWRTLDEKSDPSAYRLRTEPEFSSAWDGNLSRRDMLKLSGAALALAGLIACRRSPLEKIVPYARQPEQTLPGKPLFYATAMTLNGAARGILVETHEGRPTRIEGNPLHPDSLGGADPFMQAAILSLYDPDRSQSVLRRGVLDTWAGFLAALHARLDEHRPARGSGLRILTETVCSPTLAAQIRRLLRDFPEARWHAHEPVGAANSRAGAELAFGEAVAPVYRFGRADRILSLEADFLFGTPGSLRYARDFSTRRRAETDGMNRLYVLESTMSLTGASADHRLPLRAAEIERAARRDLRAHRGRSLVLAGEPQPPVVHALAAAMNRALGNEGHTVYYIDPPEARGAATLAELASDMDGGRVETLLILGGNPAYTAPSDLSFAEKLARVPFAAHLGSHVDETSARCLWHIPKAHFLEGWSDARAFDGTVSVVQPLIEPLYGGRSAHEILAAMSREAHTSAEEIVRAFWKEKGTDALWRKTLHDGVMQDSAFPPKSVALRTTDFGKAAEPGGLEIVFRPDPRIWDGRFANNGWLQELPKPLTGLTWDNAALVSSALAGRLGLRNGDVVELRREGRGVKAPVWIAPGQAEESVTVTLGYGRERAGQIGTRIGFDAYRLRTAGSPWFAGGLELTKTGSSVRLAGVQDHHRMHGRAILRETTYDEFRLNPAHAIPHKEHGEGLYAFRSDDENQWGMSIDLTACIGCGACTVACQAENNIPVVGKDQVLNGREMHWIRVDNYYEGEPDNPRVLHQPVPCMHCENAPCEPVCPVGATTHSDEGLNEMTYNRCVGTRYCSNNCPYKVRRFNFLDYVDPAPVRKLQRNPDVTVRSRGVMEKCTYCVQRINAARVEAKKDHGPIRDGDVVTACQSVCPAQAIVFGNIKDPNSRVARAKAHPLSYGVLEELNTKPRTTYLAAMRNPNSDIADV
jgi:Fe-S-cluster-containing dehydrogenase component